MTDTFSIIQQQMIYGILNIGVIAYILTCAILLLIIELNPELAHQLVDRIKYCLLLLIILLLVKVLLAMWKAYYQ